MLGYIVRPFLKTQDTVTFTHMYIEGGFARPFISYVMKDFQCWGWVVTELREEPKSVSQSIGDEVRWEVLLKKM